MKKKILIITHTAENDCVDVVTQILNGQNTQVVRFNTDLYPISTHISSKYQKGKFRFFLSTDGTTHDISEFYAIWYRRLRLGENLNHYMKPAFIKPTIDESLTAFWGALDSCDTFILDTYMKHRIAANKMKQLTVAQSLGMQIPNTLVTNDNSQLKRFFKNQKGEIIMKMHHSFAIYDEKGNENVVFTNKFPESYLEDKMGLQLCPLTFQANIDKRRELRVTVAGNKIFTAAVDSQKLENARDDWRKEGTTLLYDWYEYDIPGKLKKQILEFMDIYQLNYGAFDFIENHKGDLYFLEVNSGGEYFWIDLVFKHQISESIAEVLMYKKKRRARLFPRF
ncbi:MAG: MvdD family ATP-grasp ribosomal peptide maturase [Bacteroidetes bacterium]|nr:MvdD family ATP-grasp ribosomal peptide maturase [Bacteroidota bacterium]